MIEYGLSVSLNTTPRSPRTPRPGIEIDYDDNDDNDDDVLLNAPRKMSFADLIASSILESGENERSVENDDMPTSISPRVLFTDARTVVRNTDAITRSSEQQRDSTSRTRRHLNFDIVGDDLGEFHSLSPVSFKTSSLSVYREEKNQSIGECGVCYSQLPLRANHVFTLCGHLFCLRCLLKWWDTATTCPICRAEIFDADADAAEEEEAAREAARNNSAANEVFDNDQEEIGNDDEGNERAHEEDGVVDPNIIINQNEGLWMRREFWNGRADRLIHSDEEDASGESADAADAADAADDHRNGIEAPVRMNPAVTRINRYLNQDTHSEWSRHISPYLDDLEYQLTHQLLSEAEIQGLRENRDIAMTLFARMRFRETLFHSTTQFMGRVWDGVFVGKNEWLDLIHNLWYPVSRDSIMYEFVIRRNSEISPLYEVNLFGFIKDIAIHRIGEYNAGDDYDWEELHEYVFIADVFTPTDFYIHDERTISNAQVNYVRSYGGYNMEEGTITTQELAIPFSQVRRLYLISGHERSDV